ncbi:MAG: hypothetical protein GY773_02280, partial [Actinomycetia bacterium]|nr:hypothetical protein [Actinomycetes bacterium]
MPGWKQALVALATFATLITASPASDAAVAVPVLENSDWEAPVIVDSEGYTTQGLLDDDPNGLVPKTPFVQRYSLDADHWEVWLCGATTRTMPQVLADLRGAADDYFDAMSGGLYEPVFTAGGSHPDEACATGFLNGSYSTVGTPEGVLIIDAI